MFGPVFGYASEFVEGRQVAYVGSLTPGVPWQKLWKMAVTCNRDRVPEWDLARWIVTQATRALICGSDVVMKLEEADWEIKDGGREAELGSTWCGHDLLITGDMVVPDLSAEQVARKPTAFPHYG
ncbi:hypothetical protein ACFY7C_19730 [Streptomyces sp. NPDC012769]|uniref:hypothetical protein n=1 Tax=Streptomyces sp. NPDC012769 TaxID=3364848 RepID=UPI00367DC412